MDIGTVNWLAIIAATVAAMIVGFGWFGPKTFYPVWARALGKDPKESPTSSSMGLDFGCTALGAFP